MTIFGGICGFQHPRWCMCSRESGLYLFSFGIVITVFMIAFVAALARK